MRRLPSGISADRSSTSTRNPRQHFLDRILSGCQRVRNHNETHEFEENGRANPMNDLGEEHDEEDSNYRAHSVGASGVGV